MNAPISEDARQDVVTVIRLVPLSGPERPGADSAIVASFESACLRTEGNALFLIIRNESTHKRLKVGDVVQWGAQPFGVVWLAEQGAGDVGVAAAGTLEAEGGQR